jgi:phage terminase large subunit-like protein
VPQTRWAEEVVEEIAGFPFMSNDDLVDSTVMALMRFRQGGFIRLPSDEPEDERFFKQRLAGFPFMSNDDLVDSTVMALMRFRQGGFIRLPSDEPEEERFFKQRRGGFY